MNFDFFSCLCPVYLIIINKVLNWLNVICNDQTQMEINELKLFFKSDYPNKYYVTTQIRLGIELKYYCHSKLYHESTHMQDNYYESNKVPKYIIS